MNHTSEQNSALIQGIKKVLTPLLTTLALLYLFLLYNEPVPWFHFSNLWFETNIFPFFNSFFLVGISIVFSLLCAELTNWVVFKRASIDVSTQSFIIALRTKDWYGIFIQFPLILLFEEILFRGIVIINIDPWISFPWLILFNGLLFGVYHVHIYISSREWKISLVYIFFSFIMGSVLTFLFPLMGIVGVWLYHLFLVLYIYIRWWKMLEIKSNQ